MTQKTEEIPEVKKDSDISQFRYKKILYKIEEVGYNLERWHGLFQQFWSLGKPVITYRVPTACVTFNKKGRYVEFWFNPDFWESLETDYDREFLICHEILHVLYKHGIRGKDIPHNERMLANVAMDISINHSLENIYRFSRQRLSFYQDEDVNKRGCWLETVFSKEQLISIEKDREFEYYFSKLKEIVTIIEIKISGGLSTLDEHNPQGGNSNGIYGIPEHEINSLLDEVRDHLSPEENKQLKSWGLNQGYESYVARMKKYKVKQSWEKLVKKWTAEGPHDDENWNKKHRRHVLLSDKLFLPGVNENDMRGGKINLWFFQDISGSCLGYVNHFFNAAKTFPEHYFKVRKHSFDTSVVEIPKTAKSLRGGGGTCFQAIEDYINERVKTEKCDYPDAIFVFSDGLASPFSCTEPKKWYWFLEGYSTTEAIPNESQIFYLKDFVEAL